MIITAITICILIIALCIEASCCFNDSDDFHPALDEYPNQWVENRRFERTQPRSDAAPGATIGMVMML